MRVCLMVEGQNGVSWEGWLALAEACERGGLDGLFRSDHYLGIGAETGGSLDAWATLAALAARTERIRLGTLVSPATFRHPSELARVVATIDHVSGGRVECGLGAGWYEAEHAAFGFPFPDLGVRMALFEEQLELLHRQWTEERFDFEGRHYRLEDCRALPKPLQSPRPPLIVGGLANRRSVAAAVRFADEYNTVFASFEEVAERRERVAAACRDAGREPLLFSFMTGLALGRDRGEFEERLDALEARGYPRGGDAWVAGTVEEVVDRLRELERLGVERVYLQHLLHDDLDAVELLGREVVPAVA